MFIYAKDFEKRAEDVMELYVRKCFTNIESIDPTGKIVAIEEIHRLKSVFDYMMQERRNDTGEYTLLEVVSLFNDFRDEYELAIEAIELNNK